MTGCGESEQISDLLLLEMMSEMLGLGNGNLIDDNGYFQFVVTLLDESEGNPVLKREIEETLGLNDDFLPNHTEFAVRDRAFSWDLGFEEQIHAEVRKRSNSIKFLDPNDFKFLEPVYKKQNLRIGGGGVGHGNLGLIGGVGGYGVHGGHHGHHLVDPRETVATVQLESGSGATTVMPVFNPVDGDSMSVKIGAYTREERQVLIEKFRAKKKRRVWRKQIKYDCRKRLADTRPRVKGRFVSRKDKDGNSEEDSEETPHLEGDHDMGGYDDDHSSGSH